MKIEPLNSAPGVDDKPYIDCGIADFMSMKEKIKLKKSFYPILDSNNWLFYDTVYEASKATGIDLDALKTIISEGCAVINGITWKKVTFITEDPTLEQIQDTKTCYITKKDYNNFRQIQHDQQI